ncbi:hypothetical protein KW798_03440, partial [Candidatus Parcubacteria bacterium]|nr:hypothetical protein [Candidatus Parcubacteria bacterium]
MESYKDFFAGKRVTLMGLGLLGRGIGDARFLASCGAKLTVTDLKTAEQLASSLDELKGLDIIFHLGEHKDEDFTNTDMVIKAAGVRLDSPYIAKAREAGIPIYMSTALFAKFAKEIGATIVGVTGTRGKSTVTQMIHHSIPNSILGGNIRGRSTLELLSTVKKGDIIVLELDSWQLQGFGDLQLSPDVSVFTNLMPDHLNYYKDMEQYFADKANIYKYQTEPKIVAGKVIAERIPNVRTPSPLPPDWKLKILGEHNIENAALAAEALRLLGLSEKSFS